MRLLIGPTIGLVLTLLALAPCVSARQVVVQSEAPFRNGPNQRARPLGSVPVGTQAEVIGQSSGWIQLKLQDGRTGYVFQNNLRDVPEPTPAETSTSTTVPAADGGIPGSPATTVPGGVPISDDLPTLKNEITSLRAKVESLTETLDRQRAVDGGEGTGLVEHAPRDGAVSMTIAALLVGLFFGWLLTTVILRRSDRRQWNKLRF